MLNQVILNSGTINGSVFKGLGSLTINNATLYADQINVNTTQTSGQLRTASNLSLPSGFNQTGGDIYLTISSNSCNQV